MKTRQLARILKKEHKRTKSWPAVGRAYGITPAMAWKIAYKDYDPADPEIRQRLGLGARPCPTCHRLVTVPRKMCAIRWRHLDDLKVDDLLYMLEHREVMA